MIHPSANASSSGAALRRSLLLVVMLALGMAAVGLAIDLNQNGLSDIWEQKYGVSETDADVDYDGDGLSNRDESQTGLDPHNPNSRFELGVSLDLGPHQLRLRFNTVYGKIYQLESSADLINWTVFGDSINGSGDPVEILTALPPQPMFFRGSFTSEADVDGDGLSAWEERELGTSDQRGDTDGDGLTDPQEYAQSSDPNDYYNGRTPQIIILAGDNQQSMAESYLPEPLLIQVRDENGNPLANAPVQFEVFAGSGSLAVVPGDSASQSLAFRTLSDGTAQAVYRQPSGFGAVSLINASTTSTAHPVTATFHATTLEGLLVNPTPVTAIVNAGQSAMVPITLTNATVESRHVTLSVEGGTIEQPAYRDSDDDDGPAFVWNDISATGVRLNDISDADEGIESVDLSFAFPYFGAAYSQVHVNSNGFVTLETPDGDYEYYQLPSVDAPANEIAAFHTDLNTEDSGDIYYQDFGDRVVIQFSNAARYAGDGVSTFQIVLQNDGAILFYYKEMTGTLDDAVVGIQNATKDKGLTIAYQQSYLKDNLAVRIDTSMTVVSISPTVVDLPSGQSASLEVTYNAAGFETGDFDSVLHAAADNLSNEVSIKMLVNDGPEVTVNAPPPNAIYLEGDDISLGADAFDLDGVAVVEFYDGATKLGESASAGFAFNWQGAAIGAHTLTARAIDTRGAAKGSAPVPIDVQVDTNQNSMGDTWEMVNFGNLGQAADGDFDQDGLINSAEFRAQTNPSFADTDHDGVNDGAEVNIHHSNASRPDTDGDGMTDGYEVTHALDLTRNDSQIDSDGDGLTNIEELKLGTDPNLTDTDGDDLSDNLDGWPLTKAIALPKVALRNYALIDLSKTRIWGVNNSADGLVYYPLDRIGSGPRMGDEFPESYIANNRLVYPLVFNDEDRIAGMFVQGDDQGRFGGSDLWPRHAFIWDDTPVLVRGEMVYFAGFNIRSYIGALNNAQQAIVYSWNGEIDGTNTFNAVYWDGAAEHDLGLAVDFSYQVPANNFPAIGALKLNNQGVIAGRLSGHNVLIKDGQQIEMPGEPVALTDSDSEGLEIIVGYSSTGGPPYVWRGGQQDDLPIAGLSSWPLRAINNRGQILGSLVLWQNGRPHALNNLIAKTYPDYTAKPEWTITDGKQINDLGMILAEATHHVSPDRLDESFIDVLLIPADLVSDSNRDGIIDDNDRDITEQNPFRWWINDDNDVGELGGDDIPLKAITPVADYWTTISQNDSVGPIDGIRDLIDFFPLYLDIKQLLELFPPGPNATYRLKQGDGALNFAYTDLKPEKTGDFLRALEGTDGLDNATALGSTDVRQVTSAGVVLDATWLNQINSARKGVLLLEGRAATDKPLVLEVSDAQGKKITEISFPLRIDGVEKMFRHVNLTFADQTIAGRLTDKKQPSNYPDYLTNSQKFVFVHGFNVSPDDARGWNCEMFKRMHQSGSRAKFYGITWHGDETNNTTVPDYHKNVDNAFATAVPLANLVRYLGDGVTVAAHSLGNVVVGSAIQDWGAQPAQYYMIDAAVALEAYDGATPKDDSMLHPDWTDYRNTADANRVADRAFASEWYLNPAFSASDMRKTLTWRDRFGNVGTNTYNFYSSNEDVLRSHSGSPSFLTAVQSAVTGGQWAWVLQEKLKGKQISISIGVISGKVGSTYGGWRLSENFYEPPAVNPHSLSAAEVQGLSNESLLTEPVFDPGFLVRITSPNPTGQTRFVRKGAPDDWIMDLTDLMKGSATAATHKNQLLAEMFPALTLASGGEGGIAGDNIFGITRNFDMPATFKTDSDKWPIDRGEWHHSNIKQVSHSHLYKIFDTFVELGNLQHD